MKNRPVLKIETDKLMLFFQAVAISCIVLCWGLSIYYYQQMPQTIPTHFDAAGNPDNYGGKATIFLFPVIASFLIFGIYILAKYPHIFNYMQEVTEENARRLYKQSIKMLYIVSAIVGFILLVCVVSTIAAVFNVDQRMDIWSLPIILGLSGVLTTYSIIAAVKSARLK